jgi:hypothetical protein
MECRVPVGWKCVFDNVLTNEQVLYLVLGLFGMVALTIIIVTLLLRNK